LHYPPSLTALRQPFTLNCSTKDAIKGPVRGTCFHLYVILDIFSRTWSAGWWANRRLPNFTWYNQQHRHSGIGMMTPESVYTGRAAEVRKLRQATLESAYLRTPNRFKNRRPQPPSRSR
jgi:hypothetical protein